MGRPRSTRKDLPEHLSVISGTYYFRAAGAKAINLGKDYAVALGKYAQLLPERQAPLQFMRDVMDRYLIEVVPLKADRTQRDNQKEMANLRRTFGDLPPDSVTAQHIYRYMDARGAPVRANREVSLLSHVFKKAIRWGVATHNPCQKAELERNPEAPRTRDVKDHELAIFKKSASPMVVAYCDFKHLTGMRKGDILMLLKSNLQDDGIHYMPRKTRKRDPKTGARVARERVIEWSPELREVVERIQALRQRRRHRVQGKKVALVDSVFLFASVNGSGYYNPVKAKADGFDAIWKRYMKKAKAAALAEGWELEHFTEHDVRAKAGKDAQDAGQDGAKLLGNSDRIFHQVYDRGVQKVVPLKRRQFAEKP